MILTDRKARRQIAEASAVVDRADTGITMLNDELATCRASLAALNTRLGVVQAETPADDDELDQVADRLLDDPDASTGDGFLTKLIGNLKKRRVTDEERGATVKAIQAAIRKGKRQQDRILDDLKAMQADRRKAMATLSEITHQHALAELATVLDRASEIAKLVRSIENQELGLFPSRLDETSRVFLIDRRHTASGRYVETELFPKWGRKHSGLPLKLDGSALDALRAELRAEHSPVRGMAA